MIKDKKCYRILFIEDNPGDFTIIEEFLSEQILNPVIVNTINFKETSELLTSPGVVFDVILLDLTLADKSGQNLITEMLRLASLCPIIILTGYADIDFSIKSISQGILDYLLKDDLNATTLYKSIIYSIERKKNITQLIESEKRFSDLFRLSPQAMWVFDTETFKFLQVNKATTELYGYTEDEFLNMTLMDLKLEEDIAETKERIRMPYPESGTYKRLSNHYKKSGEIIQVEIYATPILIKDKILRSVIAIDVTEKNLYEHKIIKAIIKTQEDERYEIGGELHDNVCQILATSQLNLGLLKDSLTPATMPLYNECKANISLALEEIRNLSHRLAPAFFDDSTMDEAVKRLLNAFNADKKWEIFLHFDDAVARYQTSLEIQLNLYRILQEQLRNIQKYAAASVVEVDVLVHNNKLKMRIADNGVGFEVDKVKRGIGMANMKRRTELFSGKFEIYSSPCKGCEIMVEIPLGKQLT